MATTISRKKKGDKDYINNKDFSDEIMKCKEKNELSKFAINCFIVLANRAVDKLYFEDSRDREDCIQSAIFDCIKYWRSFDSTGLKNPNAFAYFTQICKNGYAKEWKKIHKKTGLDKDEKLEFISLNTGGENSIYSI
jgi:hypothetical protein